MTDNIISFDMVDEAEFVGSRTVKLAGCKTVKNQETGSVSIVLELEIPEMEVDGEPASISNFVCLRSGNTAKRPGTMPGPSKSLLASLFRAGDVTNFEIDIENPLADLIGMEFGAEIKTEEYQGEERARVKKFFKA